MQTHSEQHRKARKDRLRAAQQAWIDEIERALDITPTEIANLSGISPATLTRLRYNPDYNGTLSAAIVDKIELATKVPAPPGARSRPPIALAAAGADTGARAHGELAEQEAEPYTAPLGDPMAGMVTAAVAGRAHVVPWTLRSRALEDEGYMPGDVMIVDLNGAPAAGDIVCAQLYDFERAGNTRTVFRLYHPPFLVGASRDEGARVPQLIDQSVGLKGVVEYVIRARRRGPM